ncbi:TonB-dependent receptor [Novosphingobium sp. FSW06-99]|uniref:TonB-dependent receptor n=1 Tax=Novosphingobium sp. FSW06-99 TaxID=1739113 RepID=UPI00076D2BCE|nr:TonB-dependent receptor [Novosphingobium sp. FSW06-99]
MKRPKHRRLKLSTALSATTILAGIACPMLAMAQDAVSTTAPAPPPTGDGGTGLDTIVVTATREKTSVQKVPISMQAFSATALEDRQVQGLSDLATLLPSVSFAGIGPGRNTPYFRGIVPAGGNYASVGYYLDDIPITGTGVPEIHTYDIERIEALSGPQGTLYGAGSLAGTIRFITDKPKIGKWEYGMEVEANKYGGHGAGGNFEGYINVPVSENVAIRVMAYYRHDGGYINNTPNNGQFADFGGSPSVLNLGDNNPATSYTLNNSNIAKNNYNPIYEYGGRFQMLWEPGPGWEVMPEITAQRQTAYGYFGYDPNVGQLDVHDYSPTRNDDRWFQAELSIHGHIGDWDVFSATGYFKRQIYLNNDYTYYSVTYDKEGTTSLSNENYNENYLQFFSKNGCTGSGATLKCTQLINPTQAYFANNSQEKFTQEVRIKTPAHWPFDVTLGAFYQNQFDENNSNYYISGLGNIEGYTESGGGLNPAGFGIPVQDGGTMVLGSPAVKGDTFYLVENNQYYHDEAIFGEGHYAITPNLKFTGGLRYFWTAYDTLGLAGVMGSAQSTSSSLFVPTGTYGCPTPLPTNTRLTCLNSNPAAADEVGRYRESGETHKAALDWQFESDKMVYFNYSTGFRPGGFNRPLRIRGYGLATVEPFKSEKLSNFELGIKTTWNNIFRLNVSAYYETWNNIQYSVVVAGTQGAGITGNAGTAHVKGVEYDANLKLGKFTISTNGAYNDARLASDFCNFVFNQSNGSIGQLSSCSAGTYNSGTPTVAATGGTRLPRQPMFKGTTSVRYDTEVGDYKAYIQGAMLYQTGATQNLNTYLDSLLGDTPGFASVDFSVGANKGPYHVELFIQNAFNELGQLTKNTFCSIQECSNSARTFTIKPQFFGIKFAYNYK